MRTVSGSCSDAAKDRVIECVLPKMIKTSSGWMLRYPSRHGRRATGR